jgi:hypothetical protein
MQIFTDANQFLVRTDVFASEVVTEDKSLKQLEPTSVPVSQVDINQRALMLATAISIDYDYFSRHSHGPGR